MESKLTRDSIDAIPELTTAARAWLHAVAEAQESGKYLDLDALLLYAARLIARFSIN